MTILGLNNTVVGIFVFIILIILIFAICYAFSKNNGDIRDNDFMGALLFGAFMLILFFFIGVACYASYYSGPTYGKYTTNVDYSNFSVPEKQRCNRYDYSGGMFFFLFLALFFLPIELWFFLFILILLFNSNYQYRHCCNSCKNY